MKKLLTKLLNNIRFFFINFVSATKSTETQILSQRGVDSGGGCTTMHQDVTQGTHALAKALLKGELTEEVKQLRYRTYKVDREAKKYKYFAPTLALKKKEGKDNKFISYDKSDGLDVITIQDNYPLTESIVDALNQIENGGRGNRAKYKIEIKRSLVTRFRIEEFLKKLVVKRIDETHAMLDFYFSKYPEKFYNNGNDKSFRSKAFINELEKIRNNLTKSDILEMEQVRFVTNHAYHQDDLIEFVFKNISFNGITEFDGDYVLKFKSSIEHDGVDLTSAYYNKTMDEKYKNKEKKELTVSFQGDIPVETYTCSDCGKTVNFDVKKIDEKRISEARSVDEKTNNDDEDIWDVLSYIDMQVVEQTIGKKLCKKCLKKYLDNRGFELK